MKEPKSLQEAIPYFGNPDNCIDYLAIRRWRDGKVVCPTCGSGGAKYSEKRRTWQCGSHHPKREFSIKIGTIMEDSAIGLDKWLTAMWLVTNCKNGVSSYEVARDLKVTQKSAWFMLHRIRLAMQNESAGQMGEGGGGPVEVDETFIGGRIANMHKSKKARMAEIKGRALKGDHMNKSIVMGMLDRSLREVRARVVPNVRRDTLQGEILREVSRDSAVYTDEWIGYRSLPEKQFVHEIVNHVETYVNGQVHTNGIENFWSLLKRTLKGTYVAVEPFHLQRYVDEQVFRFNNRATKDNPLTDADRFSMAVRKIVGKRLTFAELTGKAGVAAEAF
jgi:transposase-like protein